MINLIAALTYFPEIDEFVVGIDGKLPHTSSEDMQRFKRLTTGNVVIMGRKTFYTLDGALPDRTNVVLSRDPQFCLGNSYVARNLEEALEIAFKHSSDIWIIGGGEIYRQVLEMDLPDRLYISEMKKEGVEDVIDAKDVAVFPPINKRNYKAFYIEKFEDHDFKILSKNSLDVL